MNFLETIFQHMGQAATRPVLQEVRENRIVSTSGAELLSSIQTARAFLRKAGLKKGDRCVLLAHNSIRWAALDLALMADGILVVPLYARQAAGELVTIMKDCSPALICCGDESLSASIAQTWLDSPRLVLFDEVFAPAADASNLGDAPLALSETDPITIIYTSGTSGVAKGVVLTVGNVSHMVPCTT